MPLAAWTRIWCVRPVSGRKSTSARPFASATTHQWVTEGLPFFAGIIRQPFSALLFLLSASSTVPSDSAGTPARIPR